MSKFDNDGNLISELKMSEILTKIKKNYDYCRENDLVGELVHGKYQRAFHLLIESAVRVLNEYAYDIVMSNILVLSDTENGKVLSEKYYTLIGEHASIIRKHILHGDMAALTKELHVCREEFLPSLMEYMNTDQKNILEYIGFIEQCNGKENTIS